MGGLAAYLVSGFIFYLGGAVALAGLPYWSGYYCKVALWGVVSRGDMFVGGVQVLTLLSSGLTYIYLGRLGVLVFGSCRAGHRSIYRVM